MDIDPHVVSDLFLADKKSFSVLSQNGRAIWRLLLTKGDGVFAISRTQLKGGLFESVLAVNEEIINLIIDFFENLQDSNTYHFTNLAFKSGTDDERNSPYRIIADSLMRSKGEKFLAHQTQSSREISGLDLQR